MDKKDQLNIGVFFGSKSPEHDISIITAQLIISGLRGLGYRITPVYLTKKGEWLLGPELGTLKTFTDPSGSLDSKGFREYFLDLESSIDKLVFKKKGLLQKSIVVDVAFPAFHGSFGEDGTIQGFFEIFNVPYVGCDVTSSAITMDKILTKQFYCGQGIPTTKFLFFDDRDWKNHKSEIVKKIQAELTWPIFVKPAKLGSSIGIAKAKTPAELENAVDVAIYYGARVLVEESVENLMDVTCAVLGHDDLQASLLQESIFSDELFSYEDKYLDSGGAQFGKARNRLVIPARLDSETTSQIQAAALQIFKLFGCSGIARVDFLYDKASGKYYANEVNTLPGTLYHHLWAVSGIKLPELLERLLDSALARHKQKGRYVSSFASDILKQVRSTKLQLKKTKTDEQH